MKTKIKSIDYVSRIVKHESGVTTRFEFDEYGNCDNCVYSELKQHCKLIPCNVVKRVTRRNDPITGVFKQFIK